MDIQEIRTAIAAAPELVALVPDTQAIADALSVGRTRPNRREIGNGTILETIGLAAGNELLDVIQSQADFRHVRPLLEQGRLIASSPLVVGTLQSLVGTVLTQPQADALISLGRDPDPVPEMDVRRAVWHDDGTMAV